MPPTTTTTHKANGNQAPNGVIITRTVGSVTHTLTYDGENRLVKVMNGSTTIASFVYNGDGERVKSTLNGVTTTFVGNYYEKTGTNITKYYYMGTTRVAMRNTSVKYLFGDQLGSTSVTTSSSGVIGSQERYKPFGEMYYTSGTLPTRYTFTGQYSYTINTNEIGLMYYGARFYDSSLGRFAQADTIVPLASQGVQAWDRYAYINNNPVNGIDPTGMWMCDIYDIACAEPGDLNVVVFIGGWDEVNQSSTNPLMPSLQNQPGTLYLNYDAKDSTTKKQSVANQIVQENSLSKPGMYKSVAIVGHSAGGDIGIFAMEMVDQNVSRKLVLLDPGMEASYNNKHQSPSGQSP